ncbi:acyl-CoA dehydrogenase family protein [Actinocorallia sp. A-T 12471]|uniref:acyl-CoA dehydrogenase family protein n=1 Tax=Actinocorallia sp. A-T 12471 TaxID=3089813 RepID=UPI0029D1A22D|nr:acyl-CoA dehydrogenase family protein [Actinocorallia sp. A-T 12471]MDX6743348.1 acyl-CoA dehydrogenase family protein [Actinocorallia sp. A-T 12471]
MRFAFTDDQRMLAATVAETLAKSCPPALVRAARTDPAVRRGEAWAALAGLGLLGATVPEDRGGLGLTALDTVLAWVEVGRACAPGPLVETAVAAPLLLPEGSPWLARIASGEAAASVRCAENPYLLDADVADLLLLPEEATASPVEASSADGTRRLFTVQGETSPGGAAADHASVAVSAQLLGLGDHLLDAAVAYAGQRRQFGKAIGSFQAVKHLLADVSVGLRFAEPLVHRAAYSLVNPGPDTARDVSAAKVAAAEAAHRAARVALQVHGAIGYTDELDLHLWLSRVWALVPAWGDPAFHRARLRAALLGAR